MKKFFVIVICFLVACFSINAQKKKPIRKSVNEIIQIKESPELQTLVNKAANETIAKFAAKNFKAGNLAITLIDLRDPNNLKMANFNGEQKIYPASVVKMFYMTALERGLEDGKIKLTPELERGLKDMIVDSSNDATNYILDVLTDTSGGAELPEKEFKIYGEKRNAVNRYFKSLGYENINVNQKTYCEDAYGREQQFRDGGKNRNMLTTDATARLLAEIVSGKVANMERTRQMMGLMKRDFSGTTKDQDDQAHGFTAIALNELKMTDARLWSKAGWTSKTRHDAAYIETPDGLKFVLVVFTENVANEREIIPSIARSILQNFKTIK